MGRTYSISQCRYINGIDVRNDPSLALQKNHNEADIKTNKEPAEEHLRHLQDRTEAVEGDSRAPLLQ